MKQNAFLHIAIDSYLHPEECDAGKQVHGRLEVLKSFRTAGGKIILKA